MNPEAGPSSQPTINGQGSNIPMEIDFRPTTPVVNGEPTSKFKGKGKDIDWDAVRTVNLGSGPLTGPSTGTTSSTSSTRFLALSPVPSPSRQNSIVTLDQVPTRRRTSKYTDSSNLDSNSSTTLPMGRPLPDLTASQPPAKKFRPLGATPLPPGPPTVQHLRILLEPEHVDMNRPRQFFEYLRKRDGQPPRIVLSPPEIKEILEKMKRINEIWLRTMGEDEACVQCIAEWLREFMRSKNHKMYEGIVSPAIWVILKAKPPLKVLKVSRFGTLAQQCLEIAKKQNLSKREEIEKAVKYVEQMLESLKKNSSSNLNPDPASGSGTTTASTSTGPADPKKPLPNLQRTNSSSTLPNGPAPSSSTSSMPTFSAGPAPGPIRPPSGPDLSKLLASIMPVVNNLPKLESTNPPSQRPPQMPMVRPKLEPGVSAGAPYRPPPSNHGAGSSMAFRPVAAPTPMVIKREPGLPASSAANTQPRGSASGPSAAPPAPSGSGSVSYPGDNNRWSSVATPAGRSRPFDDKKKPNYRNQVIRYRDEALAEARFFAQDEGEEEWDPYWWAYGKLGKFGRSSGNMDRDEGHTMKHLHGHEPAIEWYDPPVYDTQATTVHPVHTDECQDQDQRERPILAAYYRDRNAIPPTPDESNVRMVQAGYGTLFIPELPRAYIPRPQPLPPQMAMHNPPPPPQQPHQGFGNAYRPRDVPSSNRPMPAATSSSFRPRNPPPAPTPAPGGMSSSYRPRDRGASAPALLVPKQEHSEPPIRRASTPGPGGNVIVKAWESDSSNPAPTLDLQGTIRYWRREMRPGRPALLNPLTPQEIAENMRRVNNAPPFNYEKCELEGEGDEDAEWKPPAF